VEHNLPTLVADWFKCLLMAVKVHVNHFGFTL